MADKADKYYGTEICSFYKMQDEIKKVYGFTYFNLRKNYVAKKIVPSILQGKIPIYLHILQFSISTNNLLFSAQE